MTNSYLKLVTAIEKIAPTRTRYHIGDRFVIDVSEITHDLTSRHDLMNIWNKY